MAQSKINGNQVKEVAINDGSNSILVLKKKAYRIDNLVFLYLHFRATANISGSDTVLFWTTEENYMNNAPLHIFTQDNVSGKNNPEAYCRIASSGIRNGMALTQGKEYIITGAYVTTT